MNIANITTLNATANRNPSFFHGWSFISFEENYAEDALPFQTFSDLDGPTVLFNPDFVSRDDLEKPFAAMIWVPLVLQSFATSILTAAMDSEDDIGMFTAPRWQQFRDAFCQHTKMDWSEIVFGTEEFGIDYMAEYAIEALFIESGVHSMIVNRSEGTRNLRVA